MQGKGGLKREPAGCSAIQTYLVVADGQSQELLAPSEDLVVLEKDCTWFKPVRRDQSTEATGRSWSPAPGSSADQTHDALMELYHSRFSEEVEVAEAADSAGLALTPTHGPYGLGGCRAYPGAIGRPIHWIPGDTGNGRGYFR